MSDQIRSWARENVTLLIALVLQAIAIVAYAVKLETRVSTMETRGAEYTVARMEEMKMRITVLEQRSDKTQESIMRIVEIMTKNLNINPGPGGPKP